MLFFVGIFIVIFSVLVGYTLHFGELALLWQPSEFLITVGAGIGAMVIATPKAALKKTAYSLRYLIRNIPYTKSDYLELMLLHINVFKAIKAKGNIYVESELDNLENSTLFANINFIAKSEMVKNFIVDNVRLLTMGFSNPNEFEDIIEREISNHGEELHIPSNFFKILADTLPALGIVAAVLGVIVTMRSVAEPPQVLGTLIAAALVGTFLGVLLSYGLVGPIGNYLNKYANHELYYIQCIAIAFVAHLNNNPPIVAVEFMRKSIPYSLRPDFEELDYHINSATTSTSSEV